MWVGGWVGDLRSAVVVQSRKYLKRARSQSGHVAEAPELHFLALWPNHTFPLNLRTARYIFFRDGTIV